MVAPVGFTDTDRMTPAAAIAALDRQLTLHGEDVTIRRTVKRSTASVVSAVGCRSFVRAVSADEIAGTITVTDMKVTISPTQITAASWPGQDDSVPSGSAVDQRLPKVTDKIVVHGRERQVKVSKPIFLAGVWVRCDMVVAG